MKVFCKDAKNRNFITSPKISTSGTKNKANDIA